MDTPIESGSPRALYVRWTLFWFALMCLIDELMHALYLDCVPGIAWLHGHFCQYAHDGLHQFFDDE